MSDGVRFVANQGITLSMRSRWAISCRTLDLQSESFGNCSECVPLRRKDRGGKIERFEGWPTTLGKKVSTYSSKVRM